MAKPKSAISIRLPPDLRAYLAIRAKDNERSLNAEVVSIIRVMFEADPPTVMVRHVLPTKSKSFYAVALGESEGAEDFFETENRKEAFAVATAKVREL